MSRRALLYIDRGFSLVFLVLVFGVADAWFRSNDWSGGRAMFLYGLGALTVALVKEGFHLHVVKGRRID